jgi:hypothetical protein
MAGAGAQGSDPAVPAASSLFRFNGRDWQSQKHAEDAIRAQIGRTPEMQRQNAAFQKQIAELQAQIQTLRHLAPVGPAEGQGQGGPRGQQAPSGPRSLLDDMVASGEMDYIQQIAQDPEIGIPGAIVTGLQALEKRVESRLEGMFAERVQPFIHQTQMQQGLQQFFGGAKPIIAQFPELDDNNQAPEAVEAREAVLEVLQTLPPEWLAQHPEAIGMATLWVRQQNGTPVFAQPPGSSGSPSARVAAALEAATAASTSTPIDGSGVPRPAVGGKESPQDRLRREMKAGSEMVKSESGRVLFSA